MAKKRPKRVTTGQSGQKRPKAAMPKHRNYTTFILAIAAGASNAQAAKAAGIPERTAPPRAAHPAVRAEAAATRAAARARAAAL